MSDFGTLKERIAQEMKRGDLTASSSAVQAALLSAISYYERRKLFYVEFKEQEKTTVASTTAVTLSVSGLGRIFSLDSVRIRIGSRDYPLEKRTWGSLEQIDSGQFYGYPKYYVIHSNSLRMYPPPNAAYPLILSGSARLTEISAAASTAASNAWTTEGEELVRLKAKANLFRDHVRNPSLANYFQTEADRTYKELNKENLGRTSTRRINPTRW